MEIFVQFEKMNPALVGFLRGLGYALIASACLYVSTNLGASGLVSTGTAGIVTAILGLVEHWLNVPSANGTQV